MSKNIRKGCISVTPKIVPSVELYYSVAVADPTQPPPALPYTTYIQVVPSYVGVNKVAKFLFDAENEITVRDAAGNLVYKKTGLQLTDVSATELKALSNSFAKLPNATSPQNYTFAATYKYKNKVGVVEWGTITKIIAI